MCNNACAPNQAHLRYGPLQAPRAAGAAGCRSCVHCCSSGGAGKQDVSAGLQCQELAQLRRRPLQYAAGSEGSPGGGWRAVTAASASSSATAGRRPWEGRMPPVWILFRGCAGAASSASCMGGAGAPCEAGGAWSGEGTVCRGRPTSRSPRLSLTLGCRSERPGGVGRPSGLPRPKQAQSRAGRASKPTITSNRYTDPLSGAPSPCKRTWRVGEGGAGSLQRWCV